MFRRKDRSAKNVCPADGFDSDFLKISDPELDTLTLKILIDNNLKEEQALELIKTFDREKKILFCQQQEKRQDSYKETPTDTCVRLRRALNTDEDFRATLVSFRVTLGAQNVKWINEFGREGGFQLLVYSMEQIMERIEHARNEPDNSQQEEELVNCLLEIVRSTRTCLNNDPGVRFLLSKNSSLCYRLIEILYLSTSFKFSKSNQLQYDQLIPKILNLLAVVSFLGKDHPEEYDITGNALLIRELSEIAEKKNVSRFACIVRCFHFNDPEITYRALVFINTLISCIDADWRLRMVFRSEFMSSGLKGLIPSIVNFSKTDESISKAYNCFLDEQKADYEECTASSESLSADVESPLDCFQMLMASCKNTDCEGLLQDILVRLLLIDECKYSRFAYLTMFKLCLSEIVFSEMGSGPEYGKHLNLNIDINEALKQIDEKASSSHMSRLLESAIGSKQEAISLQLKYYEKLMEFQTECDHLRKHLKNQSPDDLPPQTRCDLPAPEGIMKTTPIIPPIGSQKSAGAGPPPPAPPPPPPGLLNPKVGGPKSGGPPAPPPPPPTLLSGGNGPKAPPPPPSLSALMVQKSPDVPTFLKKKLTAIPEPGIPMKKIPWTSSIIRPTELNEGSIWAQVDGTEVANDEIYNYLKLKFSSSSKNTAVAANLTKTQPKGKEAVVIQDAKILQRLAILQGSCRFSLKEWFVAILEVDDEKLNSNLLGQLLTALPPSEMIDQLREYCKANGDTKNLPEGEQFISTLSSLNNLPLRLESMQLRLTWKDSYCELKSSISTIAEACDEILKSTGLKHFINLVLLAGNFMGRTKNSKETFAFELVVLNKLVDTKDIDNSETLLQCLIQIFHKKYNGKYTNFACEDFHHVAKASRIELNETTKTKNILTNSLKKTINYLSNYKNQGPHDKFSEKMSVFVESAQKDLATLERLWEHMQSSNKLMQKYLCFNPKTYSLEKLFCDLKAFCEHYQKIWQIISAEQRKDAQKTAAKRMPFQSLQPMAVAMNESKAKKHSKQSAPTEQGEEGVIDRIEMMLEQGRYRPESAAKRNGNRIGHRRIGQPAVYERDDKSGHTSKHSERRRSRDETDSNRKQIEPHIMVANGPQQHDKVASNGTKEDSSSFVEPRFDSSEIPSAVELLKRLRGL